METGAYRVVLSNGENQVNNSRCPIEGLTIDKEAGTWSFCEETHSVGQAAPFSLALGNTGQTMRFGLGVFPEDQDIFTSILTANDAANLNEVVGRGVNDPPIAVTTDLTETLA